MNVHLGNSETLVLSIGGILYDIHVNESKTYTNVLSLAQQYASNSPYIGIDGSVGYANNMRISTSTPTTSYLKEQTGVDTTALIPVKRGDIIRFKNCNLKVTPSNTSYGTYIYGFDNSKQVLVGFNATYSTINIRLPIVIKDDEIIQITLEPKDAWTTHNIDNLAYIMIGTDGLNESSIITINEKIESYVNYAVKVTQGYRLNSSGTLTVDTTRTTVEDYIPFTAGSVVRIKGFNSSNNYIVFYDSNKTPVAAGSHTYPGTNGSKTITWEKESDDIYKYTNISNTCTYMRVSGVLNDGIKEIVITVNEEIV